MPDAKSDDLLLDNGGNRAIVDCFRGLGILLVVCFHVVIGLASILEGAQLQAYIAALPNTINIMWQALGSELVFLFSGFLLSYLLLRELKRNGRVDVHDFYIRRLSRVVPLYMLAIAVYAGFRDFNFWEFLWNLAFVSNVFDGETIVPVGWSLEVLVQFYVLLPLFAFVALKSGRPYLVCLVGIVLCVAARYGALLGDPSSYKVLPYELIEGVRPSDTLDRLYYLLWYRATPFLIGFMLAKAVLDSDASLRRFFASTARASTTLVVGALLIAVSGFMPIQSKGSWVYAIAGDEFWLAFWTLQRLVFGVGVALLTLNMFYARAGFVRPLRWIAEWRVWRQLSENIYGIYLFHPLFLIPAAVVGFRATKVEALDGIHVLEVLLVIALTTIAAAYLSRLLLRFVERPAQQRIREWAASRRRPPVQEDGPPVTPVLRVRRGGPE